MMQQDSLWQLAQSVTKFLEPLVPYIIAGTKKAAEEAVKKVGSNVWEKGKSLWGKLYSKEQPELKEAAGDMVILPTDVEVKQNFTQEVQKTLENDPDLAREIETMMQDSVIQRVLANSNSKIEDVEQNAISNVRQEVIATNNSSIKGVRQTQNARN
ncbi:hypothetical protein [Methanosarcina siciliae]|uniref:hypothetical protein n=1 Tax=Methanosarcina siciliae TaxID=38027 RepID=UPI00064F7D85|nr:hypothetical protein [Methanosarcina siciliae]